MVPRAVLKGIASDQRVATKATQEYLTSNQLDVLDLPRGYSHTRTEVDQLCLNEDVCAPYLSLEELHRMIAEQTTRKQSFKVIRPQRKRKSMNDDTK